MESAMHREAGAERPRAALDAAGIAHDFNNLLTVIQGHGELLKRQAAPGSPMMEDVELVLAASRVATDLVRRFLALSRRQPVGVTAIDLNEVVGDLMRLLRRLVRENVEFVTRLQPRLGRVMADLSQMEQVVLNLVVNAGDAMPGGGRLTVETADVEIAAGPPRSTETVGPGSYVMLSVTDTGKGMSPQTIGRIFEPFFTTKGNGDGLGLGLATVHAIVREGGGHVAVRSEPGAGSTLTVYLPRVAP